MRTTSIAAGVLVCLLGGCGGCGNVAGSLARNQVTLKTDKGTASFGATSTLPEDFPLPRVDGSKVAYVSHVESGGNRAIQVSLELPGTDAVNGWQKALEATGAKVTRTDTAGVTGRTVNLIWEKGTAGGSATVTAGQEGKATALVMWGEKAAAAGPGAAQPSDDVDGDGVEENE